MMASRGRSAVMIRARSVVGIRSSSRPLSLRWRARLSWKRSAPSSKGSQSASRTPAPRRRGASRHWASGPWRRSRGRARAPSRPARRAPREVPVRQTRAQEAPRQRARVLPARGPPRQALWSRSPTARARTDGLASPPAGRKARQGAGHTDPWPFGKTACLAIGAPSAGLNRSAGWRGDVGTASALRFEQSARRVLRRWDRIVGSRGGGGGGRGSEGKDPAPQGRP